MQVEDGRPPKTMHYQTDRTSLKMRGEAGRRTAEAAGSRQSLELVLQHYSAPLDHPADMLGTALLNLIEGGLVERCDALGVRS